MTLDDGRRLPLLKYKPPALDRLGDDIFCLHKQFARLGAANYGEIRFQQFDRLCYERVNADL